MAAPAIGVRPGWAPGPSAQIDWSHPLSQGLVCYFLLNGRAPVDLVGGVTLTPTAAGFVSPLGFNATANNANANTTTPTHLRLSQELSLAFGFTRVAGTINANAGLFGTSYTDTDTTPYIGYTFDLNNTGTIIFNANSAGSFQLGCTSAAAANVGANIALGRVRPGQNELILNGATPVTASRTSFPTYAANSKLYVGAQPQTTNRNPQVVIQWGGIWSRLVNDAEYAMLRADPYCFLRY